MDLKIIYEDDDVLVVDKPAGVVVFEEGPASAKGFGEAKEKTLIDYLIEQHPELKSAGEAPRYGIVHRLDKDTSGILLVAKNSESLIFLQKQFKKRGVEKKYLALVVGNIKEEQGEIKTLIGRAPGDKRKQKVYLAGEPASEGKREAITEYKVVERYECPPPPRLRRVTSSKFTLLEVKIKTGRRHQIRCHFSYLHHPIAGDKMYGFKNQPKPEGLNRHFLHAAYSKIQLSDGKIHEFKSELPDDLKKILNKLEPI